MALFNLFQKKKCAECLRPIKDRAFEWNSKPYCKECYDRKVTLSRQTGQDTAVKDTAPNGLHLGEFSYTAADRRQIKAAGSRHMPPALNNTEAQLHLLKQLSAVMDITVTELKTAYAWNIPEGLSNEQREQRFITALVETILSVDHTLAVINPDYLRKKASDATAEELVRAWVVLDYYSTALKPEHTQNIQHFRDYIHSMILRLEALDKSGLVPPVKIRGTEIHIDSAALFQWLNSNPLTPQYELLDSIPLAEKEPALSLYEDGVLTRTYCLQTEGDEDFSGKYFLISVRLGTQGRPTVPVAQIDGFISDTPESRRMTTNDIGYRMEGHFLVCGGDATKQRMEMNRGQDLPMKALKYPGYTTPSNIRLIGICPDCGKSFTFHGYAFYMAQNEVAYSDDGLDCCEITDHITDWSAWSYKTDGKTFRYFNSFCCPHCMAPYIDYKKYPQNKVFGVSGCVHLGRKAYRTE